MRPAANFLKKGTQVVKPLQISTPDTMGHARSGEGEPSTGASGPGSIGTAAVVHDLGNLIQIASSAINIVERSKDMAPAHAGPMLHRARVCLEHAGAIVRQNVGHMSERAVVIRQSDVAGCLADVLTLVEAMDEPGLSLELDVAANLPAISCDPVGFRRAVLNLVLNARDAMGGKGIVGIDARLAQDGIEVRVLDDGVGMSRETLAQAFDPFFTTKTDGLGGIGLPMVQRFVRDAGGTITIESEPDIGTTVALRLPAVARAAGEVTSEHSQDESGR
ncbi:HAMP domain-containing histidine kinase [Sphingomonas sp. MMSM20]|uniref:sensor histidine kinase n=1 Tax=Sphingomonas lycopersici TaxID=2951807 RepID=UPI002237AFFF|nr:HAMP domain-containing sensor histidine kinase [Sphingomonas lycopersici]MCW6530782.1 HAMP domain-containing histidine kinase [Sphingomonas lycopersici]